jgi:hypothetical protein
MTADDQVRDLCRNIACLTLRELINLPEKFGISTNTGFTLVGGPPKREEPKPLPLRRFYPAGLGCGVSMLCLTGWVYLSVQMVVAS